jgi:hypothetical protein
MKQLEQSRGVTLQETAVEAQDNDDTRKTWK